MRNPLATFIAIAVGLLVLPGYFLPSTPTFALIHTAQSTLIAWAIPIAGVAGLIAVINLLRVHWNKLRAPKNRDLFSLILILAFLGTFIAGMVLSPTDARFQKVVTSIQVPVETSLLGVLAITLAYASLRLAQRRKGLMAIIFLVSVLLFLLLSSGFLSFLNNAPIMGSLVVFLERLPQAGARGILLGIGLGSLTTGLRILLGADRPYSG
jgi:hypothetical protein